MFITLIFLTFLTGLWFLINRWSRPQKGRLAVVNDQACLEASDEITVTIWNIGFAALGAKADLFVDGGQNMRALSQRDIRTAADAIADQLAALQSDVMLLQEDARVSFMTRGVDVHGVIAARLKQYAWCFWADFRTFLMVKPFKIEHGVSTFSKLKPSTTIALSTPQDPLYYYGFLKKYYGGVIQRYPRSGQGDWVVVNIHLSAFDDTARQNQLATLLAYAQNEYRAGNHVVIGGDWNMRLLPAVFPHRGCKDDLFKVYDFPHDMLPAGWMVGADDDTASLRSLNKPYVKGCNFTTIVDGFMISPNVKITTLKTHDLEFEHTDHHPVTAGFTIIE